MNQIFQTERLAVRQLDLTDFDNLHLLCGNAEVMKYVGNSLPYTASQTKQSLLKCLRSYGWYGFGGWALIFKETGEFAGYGGLEVVKAPDRPDLFYILSPSYWNKGLASEFSIKAVDYAFRQLKLSRISASFDPANEVSMKVARKAGFAFSHAGIDAFKLPTIYYEIKQTDLNGVESVGNKTLR